MRRAALILFLAVLLPAGVSFAHGHGRHGMGFGDCEVAPPAAWGPRHDTGRARYVMVTRDGAVELLLTHRRVALQLSDRTMREIDREMDRELEDEDGVLADAIKSAVLGGVRALLRHSLECPLEELRDARYRDGRLELVTVDGERVFEDVEIDDRDLLESFRAQDARAFVEEFHRLKRRGR
jgi:hypothetical protein